MGRQEQGVFGKRLLSVEFRCQNAAWRGRWGSKAGMPDLMASGRGWEGGWGLQPGVKTATWLQWQVLFEWAAWLDPPALL